MHDVLVVACARAHVHVAHVYTYVHVPTCWCEHVFMSMSMSMPIHAHVHVHIYVHVRCACACAPHPCHAMRCPPTHTNLTSDPRPQSPISPRASGARRDVPADGGGGGRCPVAEIRKAYCPVSPFAKAAPAGRVE